MKFTAVFLLLFFQTIVSAQPQPCEGAPKMQPTCLDACVICDIDGFTGRNNGIGQGQTFNGFCTSFFHNMNYIAFIAGTVDLTINVTVSNCTKNRGLEIGLWESFDCSTFTKVSQCDTDVSPNTTVAFSNIVPLVVGQHYYLVMDGSSGDVCDWTFNVVEGSTAVGQLTTSGIIAGKKKTCPNLTTTYTTSGDIGANIFYWTVNGISQNTTSKNIDIDFPGNGIYEVCVTAANVCDIAPPSCTFIEVITPEVKYITEEICKNNCLEVADTILCESGKYDFVIKLPNGCDSLIYVDLTILPQAEEFIDINLCVGETFFIGNNGYKTTGTFLDTVKTSNACDSIISLDLFMIECEIIGSTDYISPICKGEENGFLLFSVENGSPPFNYTWEKITEPTIGGSGTTSLLIDNLISNVPAGVYEINIVDGFGNDVVLFQEVVEPAELSISISALDIKDYNTSCFGGNDGMATAEGTGGIKPYTFEWSNGQSGQTISNLGSSFYSVNLTDASGCFRTSDIFITEPPRLTFAVDFNNPDCEGFETGFVRINSVQGGTPPYSFSFDNNSYSEKREFRNLMEGEYTVYIKDNNDCISDTTSSIFAPDIPILYMGESLEVVLGCEIPINVTTNETNLKSIRWIDLNSSLSCDTCLQTIVKPYNDSELILIVVSKDDCSTTDSIKISVDKVRDIYFPNVFTPNGDGINDYFKSVPGKSVSVIRRMTVFSRWGEVVYSTKNEVPSNQSLGWNGTLNGEKINPGVFVWIAEVEYLDGIILTFSGDVSIVL